MARFPRPPGARRELLDFMVQGEINRCRHTDHLAGRHFIRTNQCPPPPSPIFLRAACPSCRPTNSVKALKATALRFTTINFPQDLASKGKLNLLDRVESYQSDIWCFRATTLSFLHLVVRWLVFIYYQFTGLVMGHVSNG